MFMLSALTLWHKGELKGTLEMIDFIFVSCELPTRQKATGFWEYFKYLLFKSSCGSQLSFNRASSQQKYMTLCPCVLLFYGTIDPNVSISTYPSLTMNLLF